MEQLLQHTVEKAKGGPGNGVGFYSETEAGF